MKNTTIIKLNLLKEKQVISNTAYNHIFITEDILQQKILHFETMETETMYVHLAMCLQRIEQGKPLKESNDFVTEQVKMSTHYEEAKTLLNTIEETIDVVFNEEEAIMILLHLCTLLDQKGE